MRAQFTLLTGLVSYSAQRCTIGSQSYIMGCLQLHSCLAKKKKGGGVLFGKLAFTHRYSCAHSKICHLSKQHLVCFSFL